MQPGGSLQYIYPNHCKHEQNHLRRFARLGHVGEESGDDASESDSSYALKFSFRISFKSSKQCILNSGSIISSLDVRSVEGTSG